MILRVSLYQFVSVHERPVSMSDHEDVCVRLIDALSDEISIDSRVIERRARDDAQ